MKKIKRIVVKIGTSTIANSVDGLPNFERMKSIVSVLAGIKKSGVEVVVVTSGAIGIGSGKLGFLNKEKNISQKQACASVGQCALINLYDELFANFGFLVSQVLLTQQVIDGGENEFNAKNTFRVLLKHGVVPIVNANDTVSTSELNFGDNDSLSAVVASLIEADILIILTDTDGIFNKNPCDCSNVSLISKISHIDSTIREIVKGKPGALGTGGMETKLKAAEFLSLQKIPVAIVNGRNPERIEGIFKGSLKGTVIDLAGVF